MIDEQGVATIRRVVRTMQRLHRNAPTCVRLNAAEAAVKACEVEGVPVSLAPLLQLASHWNPDLLGNWAKDDTDDGFSVESTDGTVRYYDPRGVRVPTNPDGRQSIRLHSEPALGVLAHGHNLRLRERRS